MTATTPLCGYCGRPIIGFVRWAGMVAYHPECTRPGAYQYHQHGTFQPLPLTADEVRQIVREELDRACGMKGGQERSTGATEMNEPISLTYHQAQAVAERAARVRKLARQHKGYGVHERTRVIVEIGNPYYTEPNPALHGLYLKIEGHGAPVPLFAKDLGHERNFEASRLPTRDADGHVQHPDMDGIGWDEFDMGPQLRALGWHSTTVCFESDASDEARDRYDEGNSPDCSYWTPTPPEGAGWLLAAIYDTEDGPVALYVRSANGVNPSHGPEPKGGA